MTANYCNIFWSFFKIGTFTIGGGYAMIPLMQRELVERRGWISEEEFLDQLAICQAMPGVFAVNMAAMTGLRLKGWRGSAAAIVGNVIVPIAIIILLAATFGALKGNPYVERVFRGIRPAVVALIAAPVFNMTKSAKVSWKNCYIPISSALLVWLLGVNPIVVVLVAAAGGYLYGRFKAKTDNRKGQ